jgi:hypothetical protein
MMGHTTSPFASSSHVVSNASSPMILSGVCLRTTRLTALSSAAAITSNRHLAAASELGRRLLHIGELITSGWPECRFVVTTITS